MSDGGDDSCLTVPYPLGSIMVVVLSWDMNHAVLWAILHALLSWFYVIYYVIVNWSQVRLRAYEISGRLFPDDSEFLHPGLERCGFQS